MDNWCEIFKIGTHTDSKGNIRKWTEADLEKMKQNFEKVHNAVPICCGHPKTSSPAYGWFDKLKTEGGKLWATFKNVLPEFEEACKKGLFKNRSLSISPDLTIRHLAFLGAQAPAIKGLEQFCFSEENNDDIKIEFNDDANSSEIEKSAIAEPLEGNGAFPLIDKKIEGAYMTEELQKQLDEKDSKIAELELKIKKQEDEAKNKEFSDFADEMIKDGHILPAQRQGVIDILNAVKDTNFDFEDENKNPEEIVKGFISSLNQIEFSDVADKAKADEPNAIDFSAPEEIKEAILKTQAEYKQKGIDLSVDEAYKKLKGV